MNLLFSMSLAGSLVFLVYLLAKPLTMKYLTAKNQMYLLRFIMLFFLIPYQYYKYRYEEFVRFIFRLNERINLYRDIDLEQCILIAPNGQIYFKNMEWIVAIIVLWTIVLLLFFIIQIYKYLQCRKFLFQISDVVDPDTEKVFANSKESLLKKEKNISLLMSKDIQLPFSMGIFKPCIIIPNDISAEDQELILLHELVHIKNHDVFYKVVAIFIVFLHLYNPLAYIFFFELCNISEQVCDETVLELCGKDQYEKYGLLLINYCNLSKNYNILFGDYFSQSMKKMKGRVYAMKRENINKTSARILSGLIVMIMVLSIPLSVNAYSPKMKYGVDNVSELSKEYIEKEQEIYYISDPLANNAIALQNDPTIGIGFEDCDVIFIDTEGNVYKISEDISSNAKVSCNHHFSSGYKYMHDQNGSGCTVTTYNVTACTICGYTVSSAFVSSITYATCPH